MNKKNLLVCIITAVCSIAMFGMEKEYLPKRRYLTNENDIPGEYVKILEQEGLPKKALNAYVITNPRVLKSIENSSDKVIGKVGQHYMNKHDNLSEITSDPQEHGKSLVGLANSPSKKIAGKSSFIIGSANPTNSIYKYGNYESVVVGEDDTDLSNQLYTAMTSTSPVKEKKEVILKTPEKNTVYSSRKVDLNKSRSERINTVAEREGSRGKILASSMSFNDDLLAAALINAANKKVNTQLILDRASMTNLPLLETMRAAGVNMFMHNPAGQYRRLMHNKSLITNNLFEITTGNFTQEGNDQNNISTYFVDDAQLRTDAEKDYERVKKACIPFDQAVPLFQKAQEQKQEKKKVLKRVSSFDVIENIDPQIKKIKK